MDRRFSTVAARILFVAVVICAAWLARPAQGAARSQSNASRVGGAFFQAQTQEPTPITNPTLEATETATATVSAAATVSATATMRALYVPMLGSEESAPEEGQTDWVGWVLIGGLLLGAYLLWEFFMKKRGMR